MDNPTSTQRASQPQILSQPTTLGAANPTGKKSRGVKFFLLFFILLLVLLSISLVGYGYLKTSKTNDANNTFRKAQSKSTYHVYKPTVIPGDRVFWDFTSSVELAGKQNATQATYNLPRDKMTEENKRI